MKRLESLFEIFAGHKADFYTEFTSSGSNRRYFRIKDGGNSFIGVIGTSDKENRAFIELSKHFLSKGINVPEIFAVSEDGMCYIQEDLGDISLYDEIKCGRESGNYSSSEKELLFKTIAMLPKIQFEGAEGLNFDVCYPESSFNGRMVMFDLNYFKYCFLKVLGVEFDEILLQDDFERLQKDLSEISADAFMYRDFQARNVMLKESKPYFIDFQGGRKGPFYYDLASFVWQAKACYPDDLKKELIDTYLAALMPYLKVERKLFDENFRLFVLFRTLQVLGAYGFRGYIEHKEHFISSIPFALANLRKLLEIPFINYPYLNEILVRLSQKLDSFIETNDGQLEVSVYSFSYKKGIPVDRSGNGGGYVFDCRAVHNPGKYERYKGFTGLDREVIDFLEEDGEILSFLSHIYRLIDAHVERFIERKFTHLQICFGCTGGQHRSVYCAEDIAEHLASKYSVRVRLIHRELGIEREVR